MDPLRSDMQATDALSGAECDARIEQLLLAGLDEYFGNRYEQAINVWTRVLFLDRHHDRARAYIERARSAQAERQRELEAVLHQGIEAFDEGDVDRARQLVAEALERGVSRDLALGMLDRIERLGTGKTAPNARRRASGAESPPEAPARLAPVTGRRSRGPLTAALLAAAALGALVVAASGVAMPDIAGWPRARADRAVESHATQPARVEPLPIPAASEKYLARARALVATGRLRDALTELDRIPVGDPLRAAADRVRAGIQSELLAIAAAERPPE